MSKIIIVLHSLVFIFVSAHSYAQSYNTTKLKKVNSNLYKASDDILIKTKSCLVSPFHSEDAIVIYSKFSNDNKIVFLKSEKFCDIDKVFKAE